MSKSNQEEQVRALIEVYSSIDEDGWEPDPNFVADIMGIVEQAETAARISELEWWSVYAVQQDEPLFNAIVKRMAELKGSIK